VFAIASGWCETVGMASKFVRPDRGQSFLQAVSYREVLGEGHPVWTVIEVVEGLDLSGVYGLYGDKPWRGGRPALDPAMLLALLVFGYCEGKRSSRVLEEACWRDWAYRAICGDIRVDHSTIASFRQRLDGVLEDLFVQVLARCGEKGLVKVGVVAVDGTKVAAAASKEANRRAAKLAELAEQARAMLDEAATADNNDPADPDPGDPDPGDPDLGDPDPGDPDLADPGDPDPGDPDPDPEPDDPDPDPDGPEPGDGPGGGGWSEVRRRRESERRAGRVRRAGEVVDETIERRAAVASRRGKRVRGEPVGNVTDPDSRLQKTRGGAFIQGYNAQTVVSGDQIIIGYEVISAPTDVQMLVPVLTRTLTNLTAASITDRVGTVLADAGYWSEANATDAAGLAVGTVLIAPTKTHRVGDRPVTDPQLLERDRVRLDVIARIAAKEMTRRQGATELDLSVTRIDELVTRFRDHGTLESTATIARDEMQLRLSDPVHTAEYRKRGWLVEGTFGHVKHHRRHDRFLRRGLTGCTTEWGLAAIAHNILKLHQVLPPTGGSPYPDRHPATCRYHRHRPNTRHHHPNHHRHR